ncbi:MAG: DUF1289 domain-containing protein [Woeseiaceae bacterium]|nr:DUF1289 domain-containing protein [Woeseiaceae bacterium]
MVSSQGRTAMTAKDARGRPASPCILVCTLDDDNRCLGCGRTLEQISRWALMTAEEQWKVIEGLPARPSKEEPLLCERSY